MGTVGRGDRRAPAKATAELLPSAPHACADPAFGQQAQGRLPPQPLAAVCQRAAAPAACPFLGQAGPAGRWESGGPQHSLEAKERGDEMMM